MIFVAVMSNGENLKFEAYDMVVLPEGIVALRKNDGSYVAALRLDTVRYVASEESIKSSE
jgi:hypothetical protein